MRRISLGALVHFDAVSRLGSFSAAAAELNLSQGAVSQQVKSLEARLGRPLFAREHGALRLTPEGKRLLPAVRTALGLVGEAFDHIQVGNDRRVLKIGALPTLAAYWLIPHAARFRTAHPGYELEVKSMPADFVADSDFPKLDTVDVDVAVTYGEGNWTGLNTRHLFAENMQLACSPAYLERHRLRVLDDLKRATLLQHTTRRSMWRHWASVHGPADIEDRDGPRFEHFYMIAQAAREGMGVALLPEFVVSREVESGHLVRPLQLSLSTGLAYHLAWPQASDDNAALRRFVDWVAQATAP